MSEPITTSIHEAVLHNDAAQLFFCLRQWTTTEKLFLLLQGTMNLLQREENAVPDRETKNASEISNQEEQPPNSSTPTSSAHYSVIASSPKSAETTTVAETKAAKTGSRLHTTVCCGSADLKDDSVRIYHEYSPYFGRDVDIYNVFDDPEKKSLYRAATLAEKTNSSSNMVGMYLSRHRDSDSGIVQASRFLHKPAGRSGLKVGGYFVSEEACRRFEKYLATSSRSLANRNGRFLYQKSQENGGRAVKRQKIASLPSVQTSYAPVVKVPFSSGVTGVDASTKTPFTSSADSLPSSSLIPTRNPVLTPCPSQNQIAGNLRWTPLSIAAHAVPSFFTAPLLCQPTAFNPVHLNQSGQDSFNKISSSIPIQSGR